VKNNGIEGKGAELNVINMYLFLSLIFDRAPFIAIGVTFSCLQERACIVGC